MPGPPPKAAARRQRSRRDIGTDIGVLSRPSLVVPAQPKGLCVAAIDAWKSYWTDVVSAVMLRSDSTIALRWIKNVDRYLRLTATADRKPVVKGSTGQERANTLYDLTLKLEASIREDEKQLGIGPLNRLRLGAVVTEAQKSLADLNVEAESDGTEGDFRVTLINAAVAD